jgi:hypothetical protein
MTDSLTVWLHAMTAAVYLCLWFGLDKAVGYQLLWLLYALQALVPGER